ncbi:unnamed protein product [Cylindrotheca closterium]|uniref:Glycosyltransferase-like protein LARGE2 n=1 Tax=Cylindrotheca closterium TaxID=2856 RepID=A0AAD2G3H4_9STRA|nr:unnamed protein product [Cylindrotheca closterium]
MPLQLCQFRNQNPETKTRKLSSIHITDNDQRQEYYDTLNGSLKIDMSSLFNKCNHVSRAIALLACCVLWSIFIHGGVAFQRPNQEGSTDLELLYEKLHGANQRIKELESGLIHNGSAQHSMRLSSLPGNLTLGDKNLLPRFSAAKILFESLPFSESTFAKPLVLRNFIRREQLLNKTTIVLSTQTSTRKFDSLYQQLFYWNGPSSIAIYIKSEKDLLQLANFTSENTELLKEASFHLVMEKTNLPYPANILRNVAMEGIESFYFVAMDVDLIPLPKNCHSKLSLTMSRLSIANRTKTLFVLPAFSLLPEKKGTFANASEVPKTKRKAVAMARRGRIEQFWRRKFPQGHAPSRYPAWMKAGDDSKDFYRVTMTKTQSKSYEPYVLGFKPGVPRYWEDFRGFGRNKISFFTECYRAGYTYAVLTQFFCIHLDHPAIEPTVKKEQNMASLKVWKKFHNEYLNPKYGKPKE